MVFRVGKNVTDIKTFKWAIQDGALHYVDNRSDHEFVYPDRYQFEWVRTHRDCIGLVIILIFQSRIFYLWNVLGAT